MVMRSGFLFATALLLGICWEAFSQTAARAALPNIVVFLTDDQTLADQSVMAKTKALLADQGTTFSRFFATHGLCAPSRATFLTGQYPHNHHVLENNPPRGGYARLDHTNTLPIWVQAQGYYTAYIGKYLNGLGSDGGTTWETRPPGWDNWQALVEGGTYAMYEWTMNDNGTIYVAGSSETDYQTDALAARAAVLIQSRQGQSEPLFLVVAPASPHNETNGGKEFHGTIRPPVRYLNTFETLPLPKPPSYNEANVSDKPSFIRHLKKIDSSAEKEITKRFRDRRGALLAIDDLVEKVVNAVEAVGMLGNTVFVYASDNGLQLGEHRISNKNEVYEESLRVPLIIRGGGFPRNATAAQLVGMHDLAATLAALAGATPGLVLDGRDLKPLALDPAKGAGRSLLINAYHGSNYSEAVRTDSGYLYAEHTGSAETELYDLNADPYQLISRHNNSSYNPIRRQLRNLLSTLRTCSGTDCSTGTP